MFDIRRRGQQKSIRFRRPEFQAKLRQARRYERRPAPVPEKTGEKILQSFGLHSRWRRFVVLLAFLMIVYFLIISKVFLVKEVSLHSTGGPSVAQITQTLENLSRRRIYLVPENHILLLTEARFLKALQKDFPAIRRLTGFRRILPDKIEMAVEERQPQYVWQTGSNYYFLDQDGIVFQQMANYQATSTPQLLLTDQTASEVTVGEALGIRRALSFVEKLKELWPQLIPQMGFVSFALPGAASSDILAKTSVGFQIYFDLNRSVKVQLNNLKLLLTQKIKPETFSGLSYIDLRLAQTAYYCYRDAPCALENRSATSTAPHL